MGEPDTVLEGSDRVELAGWCLLAVPGLLYCGWRHLNRFKVCPRCGSNALMRECRAAAARREPLSRCESRVHSLRFDFAWPSPFGSTRVRLRSGSIVSGLVAFGGCAWLLGVLELAPTTQALQAAGASGMLCVTWLAYLAHQIGRRRADPLECEAWDGQGRPLHIERI